MIKTPENWYIILEYCEDGDLGTFFYEKKKSGENFSEEHVKKYMIQIANVLKYLRDNNIVHRDIKPQNILLKKTESIGYDIKLIDFNFARELDDNSLANTICGTPLYMAPEIMKSNKKEGYNSKSDLWSIGVLLYEMVYNSIPFIRANTIKQILEIINDGLLFKPIPHFSNNGSVCIHLLMRLLEQDINKRITWDEFFNHPFLKSFSESVPNLFLENWPLSLVGHQELDKFSTTPLAIEPIKDLIFGRNRPINGDEFIIIIYKALWWAKNHYLTLDDIKKIDNYILLIHSNLIEKIDDLKKIPDVDSEFLIRLLTEYNNSVSDTEEEMDISELKFYIKYTIQKLEISDDVDSKSDSLTSKSSVSGSAPGQGPVNKSFRTYTLPIPIASVNRDQEDVDGMNDFLVLNPNQKNLPWAGARAKSYPPENFMTPRKVARGFLKKMNKSYNTIKEIIGYMSNSPNSY